MPLPARPHLRLVQDTPPEPEPEPAFDDSVLLAGIRNRDPKLADAFYDRVRPIVDRTLSRLIGARDSEYEDLAQRALFEIVETVPRFRRECPLNAWLSIVVARVAYRHIRRRQIERRIFVSEPVEDVAARLGGLPSAFATRQAIARVVEHLQVLEHKQAFTFILHDAYGYDLKEIGQIMGVSLSAAQSRLVRGRRALHDRIRGDLELAEFLVAHSEELP